MCGISGLLLCAGKGEVDKVVLERNNVAMQHRGPDSSDVWVSENKKIGLSQTRLSIVDLDVRASQPMILDDGNIIIVFNGEIYNYKTLRESLKKKYSFKSTSDTEVLAYAYKEYGLDVFDKIEGMFVFVIYDKRANHTIIARDFVGQKPLVYYESKEGLLFASEIPVLLQMGVPSVPDFTSLGVYVTQNFSHIPQPFSGFKNIKKLKPGHFIIVKNGKIIKEKRYFKFSKLSQDKCDEFEFISNVIDEMKPTDVTFSSFLSGGNDSSLVCAALRKNNEKKVEVYTLRLGNKDSDYLRSKEVSKVLSLNQHIITFDSLKFLDSVEEHVKIYGEPYFHLTSVYADFILKEVRKRHKVIFTGAGGDEVYYGYNNLDLILVDIFLKLRRFFPNFLLSPFLGKKYRFLSNSSLKNVKINYYMQNFSSASPIFASKLDILPYFEEINKEFFEFAEIGSFVDLSYMSGLITENSHSLTIQGDLTGMKNSVEIRCPFLERRIISRGYSLKFRDKVSIFNLREGKVVLKKALDNIFSKSFVHAKKIGFGVEISRKEEIVNANYERIMSKLSALSSRKGFNSEFLKEMFKDKTSLLKNFTLAIKLYSLEIWFEEFVDKKR